MFTMPSIKVVCGHIQAQSVHIKSTSSSTWVIYSVSSVCGAALLPLHDVVWLERNHNHQGCMRMPDGKSLRRGRKRERGGCWEMGFVWVCEWRRQTGQSWVKSEAHDSPHILDLWVQVWAGSLGIPSSPSCASAAGGIGGWRGWGGEK